MLTIDSSSELTITDFIKNKEYQPFKGWRTVAKTENFGMLFGCSAPTFGGMLKQANFSEKECDEFINLTNKTSDLQSALSANAMSKHPQEIKDVKFTVVAESMRNSFFDTYKGLMQRINREQLFALMNGYVRTWHGPVRHLAELKYMSTNKKTKELIGADNYVCKKIFSHLLNNACNSTIQSMESRIAFATWTNIARYIAIWNLKSYCWNNIHDSLDFYVYKPETELIMALANACAAWEREPVKGIHMSFDGELSDLQDYEHRCNTYYKAGQGIDPIPIEEAIEHYNKRNGTNLKWYGCDFYDKWDTEAWNRFTQYCASYNEEPEEIKNKFETTLHVRDRVTPIISSMSPSTRRRVIIDDIKYQRQEEFKKEEQKRRILKEENLSGDL